MNRRSFLSVLSTGVVGVCVVAKIPTAWIPAPLRRRAATDFMLKYFNKWCATFQRAPDKLRLGRRLYEAYESELLASRRILYGGIDMPQQEEYLMFKGVRAYHSPYGQEWDLSFVDTAAKLIWTATLSPV